MVTDDEKGICRRCGDTRRLDADGVCRWTHGCEHRVFQHEERMRRLEAEMVRAERRAAFAGGLDLTVTNRFLIGYWTALRETRPEDFLNDDDQDGET